MLTSSQKVLTTGVGRHTGVRCINSGFAIQYIENIGTDRQVLLFQKLWRPDKRVSRVRLLSSFSSTYYL